MEPVSVSPGRERGLSAPGPVDTRAAVVVIGRNEGERLRTSLGSVTGLGFPVVYVDSGSGDGSAGVARSLGCEVVELDPGKPVSAARARNEGFEAAQKAGHAPEFIQFLDGDCELSQAWLTGALEALQGRPETAIVCGRLAERHPESSVYNRLCQLEWDRPAGEVSECGGIMLIRSAAFHQVGGFDPSIVAGEDPELCLRLRRAGWKIRRLEAPMAVHDAAMTRFSQWWTRAVRSGLAYAQCAAIHGASPDRYRRRECAGIRLWALWIPLLVVALAWPTGGWSLLGLGLYPLQVLRIAFKERRRGTAWRWALLYGVSCMAAKWPQLQGQLRFRRNRRPAIIEYKGAQGRTP